jgi:hypothetical protein
MLINNGIDLEIQKSFSCPNSTSFQENIIVSETVNNNLRSLQGKLYLSDSSFYLKTEFRSPYTIGFQNEILPGQRNMEYNTELLLISKCPDQTQIFSKEERLGRV